jgi:ribosomal subunit interface protein
MQISITGKQLAVGAAFRSHIEEHLRGAVEKYFDHAVEAHVVVSRAAHNVRVDISAQAARNVLVQGHAEAPDPYVAFDLAADRIAKRLRRTTRLKVKGRRDGADAASPGRTRAGRRAPADRE